MERARALHRCPQGRTGPIFTGGAIKGEVARATAAQKASLLNYELTIQNAFADVDNALVARQKLLVQQAAQVRLVDALTEGIRAPCLSAIQTSME